MAASLPLLNAVHLAAALVDSLWQAVALTAAAALAMRLFPSLPAAARSALWTGVLLAVLSLAGASILLPHPATAAAAAVPELHLATGLSLALVALWAGASAFRLAQLALGALRLRSLLRAATPMPSSPALAALLHTVRRPVRLCLSGSLEKPSVVGFFRPRILLPASLLDSLSEPELTHIVLHELEHLRRRDDWVNLLQQLSLVLLPLNPALLWLNRRLSLERELACDDRVLAATRARKAYAACLARVAEIALVQRSVVLAQRGVSLALGLFGRRPELVARIERILRAPRPAMDRLHTRLASVVLLASLAGGAGLLAHCPELVSFAPAANAPLLAQADLPSSFALAATLPIAGPNHNTPNPEIPVHVLPAHGLPARVVLTRALVPAGTDTLAQPHDFQLHSRQPRNLQPRNLQPRNFQPRNLQLPSLHRVAAPAVRLVAAPARRPQPQALLTSWHAASARSLRHRTAFTRMTPVTLNPVSATPEIEVWYTAIPWQGGWLVVQL